MNPEEIMPEEMPEEQPIPDGEMTDPELSPEQFEMQEGMEGAPMGEEYEEMGANAPADSMMGKPLEAVDMVEDVALAYMDYVIGIKNNKELDESVRATILLQMSQSINYLVPLLNNDKEQEMQLKREEHQMNMEMKQAELQFKQQEHEMKLSHSQAENQMKLQHTQATNQQLLQQNQENHTNNIVQSQIGHEQKMEQGKQAAELKQSSKQGSEGAK
jgi:hypothetical protein